MESLIGTAEEEEEEDVVVDAVADEAEVEGADEVAAVTAEILEAALYKLK